MGKTITGELRELLADINWTEIIDHMRLNCGSIVDGDWLDSWHAAADHACDAIDAVHANLERENASLKAELDRVLGEQDDRDGWVELPKDADGVPIRVGDKVTEHEDGYTFKVDGFMDWDGEWWVFMRDGVQAPASNCTHYHAPTVEDVLLDACKAYHSLMVESMSDVAHDMPASSEVIAEYAAKLRLAGDAS